jgi:hypothetical protein
MEPPGKATVLFFVLHDCPISNGYAPEIGRIAREYEGRGVACYVVQNDPAVDEQALRQHAREYGFPCPVLHDRQRELARRVGATVAPEAAVVTAGGTLRYLGRIDDRYAGLGKERNEATVRDLRLALDAVLEERPVAAPRTEAVGCSIGG